jgi:WD40 repeat protein
MREDNSLNEGDEEDDRQSVDTQTHWQNYE